MNATNLLANLLVVLKTNYLNNNKYAYTKYNKVLLNVLHSMYLDGLIYGYQTIPEDNKVKIKLKYIKNKPLIKSFKLISTPSLRVYSNYFLLPKYNKKYDYFFISTSTGIISSRQRFLTLGIGGVILFGIKLNYT